MRAGYLSQFFSGVAAKRLSAVEVDQSRSNQHEFNGDAGLKRLFGSTRTETAALFFYLDDSDPLPMTADGGLTWYDARQNHPTRSEFRLYFPTNPVTNRAAEGDLLLIGKRHSGPALVLIVQRGSTIENQILWLFNLTIAQPGFSVREELESDQDRIGFVARAILEQIGVPFEAAEDTYLERILARFGAQFPPTRAFSEFARSLTPSADPRAQPDSTIMAWMDREEILFRTLEKHILEERLGRGFAGDVDGFFAFSLAAQNRRKSRAGFALENHVEAILLAWRLRFERGALTEGRSRPDFLFPGRAAYLSPGFDTGRLTMLAAKSTCKDRWRQVLAEANRIERKHLLTTEAPISANQTGEMERAKLQLVVPRSLHSTFTAAQQGCLLDLEGFLTLALGRQSRAGQA